MRATYVFFWFSHYYHIKISVEYRDAVKRLGDQAGDFHEMVSRTKYKDKLGLSSLLQEPLRELPMVNSRISFFDHRLCELTNDFLQIVFTLRAVQYPASIPLSLASLQLIRENSSSFTSSVLGLLDQTGYIAEQLATVRRLYEIENIANKVVDGREPYPENQQKLKDGISVEFRWMRFSSCSSRQLIFLFKETSHSNILDRTSMP